MYVSSYTFKPKKRGSQYRLGHMADVHKGNTSCMWTKTRKILFPRMGECDGWIGQGDLVEAILPSDKKRFSISTHTEPILKSCRKIADEIKIYSSNCLGQLMGNHEHAASSETGNIMDHNICAIAGVPYLGMTAFITLKFPFGCKTLFAAHGARSNIQRNPNPLRRDVARKMALINLLADYEADIKGVGHWHTEIVVPPIEETALTLKGSRIKLRPRKWTPAWHYSLPAMFKSFTEQEDFPSYAERMLLKPTSLGWLESIYEEDGTIVGIDSFDEDGTLVRKFRNELVIT